MKFDHYVTNDELEKTLRRWAKKHPRLCELSQIGKSHEQRPIWLLTLSNRESGDAAEKPAVWVDGNLHATELAGTSVAMHLAHTLLNGYAKDARITRLLDTTTFYIVPRANPDGAAAALSTPPRLVRSGTRPYPFTEKDDGLHEEDIDGDGRILQMRIPDPHGDWKISSLDPRLMEKRAPDEHGGCYYRLLPEGRIKNFDGYLIHHARPLAGLDFNRNFPFEWRPEGEQSGAGPYPASEPETRALTDFVATHLNINVAITFHTFSRVILRPYSTRPDDAMEVTDLWVYKRIGEIGTRLTGYRCVSTFHDFKYHPKEITTGAFDDWMYDQFGVFAFTIELWDLPTQAGIKERKFIEWWREHPHQEDAQILHWADEHVPGSYVDWYPFEHPQLGRVELGGWDMMYTWRNPPPALLNTEVSGQTPFILALAEMLPRLHLHTFKATPLGNGQYHLDFVVENSGFFPTCTSAQGKKKQAVRAVRVELKLPQGAELVNGKHKMELGYLEGRSADLSTTAFGASNPTSHRARAEWVIRAPSGSEIAVEALCERAGKLSASITL